MARLTVQSTYLLMSLAYFVMPTVTWFFLDRKSTRLNSSH